MKRLWAPWRMRYIVGPKSENCLFCEIAAQDNDRENLILWRTESGFVVLNRYPYNNGHLMVVPYKHVPSIENLDLPILADLMSMVQKGLALLRAAMHPEAFNIGINIGAAAGAGIAQHVHIHIVPRWSGDTNYMAVLADTRVIPDSLESTYDQLLRTLRNQNQADEGTG